ncbi:hypothetical protein CYMTET_46641 [Cymbomonas tetramitiformis]|uniref:Uncharacterized protein n=1 Tax=Cymbomonas tetramitiformis TaxID=36881 RepID=A0AAE0BVR4_9CHLO|nr:hypothetical protein CYMTET_46641 [Cymbomonas tetramitiformis]
MRVRMLLNRCTLERATILSRPSPGDSFLLEKRFLFAGRRFGSPTPFRRARQPRQFVADVRAGKRCSKGLDSGIVKGSAIFSVLSAFSLQLPALGVDDMSVTDLDNDFSLRLEQRTAFVTRLSVGWTKIREVVAVGASDRISFDCFVLG